MGEYFYFYDSRGRQSAKARISNSGETHVMEFRYDFLNRKTAELEDGIERVTYAYDKNVDTASQPTFAEPIDQPLGKVTMITNRDPNKLFEAAQRFGYDSNGRMVSHEIELGGQKYAESFHHTLDGRIDQSTGPRGLNAYFTLGPDRNLRAVTIKHPDFSNPEKVIENIAYNAEGRIRRIDYRKDAFTEMTYHPETLFLTEIVSKAGGNISLQDLTMTFNQNGSITEIRDALTSSEFGHVNRSGQFNYDFKNQLTRIKRYNQNADFAYTEAGTFQRNDEFEKQTFLTRPSTAATQLIPVGSPTQPYTFDGFGHISSSPTLKETVFDTYGRLIQAKTATHHVFFGYDQTGRRIYKQVVSLDTPADKALYLFPMQSFHVGPQGEESFVNIGSTRLVRMEHGTGRWFYYLKDHLDSSDYLITSDGVPVEQMLYRAYGTEHKPEILSSAWKQHVSDVVAELPREKTHHRFTGKYLDDATGLYYYGARYYDPALGRFVSPDPLYMSDPERCTTSPIACNLFAYANNNPMAFIDPTGLKAEIAEERREEITTEVQRIDPTARVDSETGEISQSLAHGVMLDVVDFFVPGTGHDTGRELVSRVIESEQTTTIQYQANDARIDGTLGGDNVISYDPNYSPSLLEFDPSTGTTSAEPADPAVILGHEMIHATRMMSGDWDYGNVSYSGLDGSTQTGPNEEARTVGVGGSSQPDDITENNLREMLGENPRNHYD